MLECVCVGMLWVDMDSWIPLSRPGGFTPSEEHHMLMMPVKTVTISLPQIHMSCCFIRSTIIAVGALKKCMNGYNNNEPSIHTK